MRDTTPAEAGLVKDIDEKPSRRDVLKIAALMWAVLAIPAVSAVAFAKGLASCSAGALIVAVVGFLLCCLISLFIRSQMITTEKAEADTNRRRELRQGKPRDLTVLGNSTRDERAHWTRKLEKEDRVGARWRWGLAVPMGFLSWPFRRPAWRVFVAVPLAALVVAGTWKRKPQLLLIARIKDQVYALRFKLARLPASRISSLTGSSTALS